MRILWVVLITVTVMGCGETVEQDQKNNDENKADLCGNGVLDSTEVCDKGIADGDPGSCPISCEEVSNICAVVELNGDAITCSSSCVTTLKTTCTDGDGCCPDGCEGQDDDCLVSPICGDGVVNPGELCDGDCPESCDDGSACTINTLVGSDANCDARCLNETITTCVSDDGCCPTNCVFDTDNDCACEPTTCEQQMIACGTVDDGCGTELNCSCANGQLCDAGSCGGTSNDNVGAGCEVDEQCSSGNCDTTVPDGYCLGFPCSFLADPCPGDQSCKIDIVAMDLSGICIESCRSAATCPFDFVCEIVDPATNAKGCVPG